MTCVWPRGSPAAPRCGSLGPASGGVGMRDKHWQSLFLFQLARAQALACARSPRVLPAILLVEVMIRETNYQGTVLSPQIFPIPICPFCLQGCNIPTSRQKIICSIRPAGPDCPLKMVVGALRCLSLCPSVFLALRSSSSGFGPFVSSFLSRSSSFHKISPATYDIVPHLG